MVLSADDNQISAADRACVADPPVQTVSGRKLARMSGIGNASASSR